MKGSGSIIGKSNNSFSGYAKAKTIIMILLSAALIICGFFLNVFGGIGLYINNYESAGIALFISTGAFAAGYILLFSDLVILPAVFDIIGTAAFIYPINILLSISNERIPKQFTEPLAERIYPAIFISVLLLLGAAVNLLSPKQCEKREKRRLKKYNAEKRPLKNDEKIV